MNLFNSLILVCGNGIVYILIAIRMPSLPVSNLNFHISVFQLLLVFSFVIRIDLILSQFKTFDLTISNSCFATSVSSFSYHASWTALCLLLSLESLSALSSAHILKMVSLSHHNVLCIFLTHVTWVICTL